MQKLQTSTVAGNWGSVLEGATLYKNAYRDIKSSQVTFIYIALLTIQIVSKQLHNIKIGK